MHAREAKTRAGRRHGAGGFTLIEMMVTIAIAAILFAIGVPMFRNASLGARLSAGANNLLASVQLARSEAIKRNIDVSVCPSSDGDEVCDLGGGWDVGWMVVASDGTVIQRQESLPAGFNLTQSGGTAPITFKPIGIGMGAATFTVCRSDPVGSQERVLTVRAAGSAQVTSTTAGVCP